MSPNRYLTAYLTLDFIVCWFVWLLFWAVRKTYLEPGEHRLDFNGEVAIVSGGTALFWVGLHWAVGLYRPMYRQSRLLEISKLFQISLIGVLVVSFATFLDDPMDAFTTFRVMVVYYFGLQFGLTTIFRFALTTFYKRRIGDGRVGFATLLIGSGELAEKIYAEMQALRPSLGYRIKGFVSMDDGGENRFRGKLKRYGELKDLRRILAVRKIEEVIIALDRSDHDQFLKILNACEGLNVHLNVAPDLYDIMVGRVKMNTALGSPLVEIYPRLMAPWEKTVKRLIDVVAGALALVALSPAFAVLAVLIKLDSKGPVFYRQERIGRHFKPFKIIKFRSMFTDAEKHGPALSKDADPRITSIGRVMRKTRLDELPQFYNVLIGEMSLVGPRPERRFFIDQIVERAPEYLHLLKVKPGITSLGQVKYGYAENVDQMVERLRFDLLYIENISLGFDLKILLYTVKIVVEGRGK